MSVSYNNQTWTAGASGPIVFREKTQTPLSPVPALSTGGGINILAEVGPIKAPFGCDPGTVVEGAPPSTIVLETAPALATVANENEANRAPTANAGPDQTVESETAKVSLNGFGSTDSSEESFALHYEWKQTGGTAVTLNGANTATPSFAAPNGRRR